MGHDLLIKHISSNSRLAYSVEPVVYLQTYSTYTVSYLVVLTMTCSNNNNY